MSQVKIYGHRESLQVHRTALSDAIHAAVVEALNLRDAPRQLGHPRDAGG